MPACALAVLLVVAATAAPHLGVTELAGIRVGHWNVFWKALDDPRGQAAIRAGIDEAAARRPFDFFSLLEASGGKGVGIGRFPQWIRKSRAMRPGGEMKHLSGRSHLETIALLYRAEAWVPIWWHSGEFVAGRPYLLALFESRGGRPAPGGLPHASRLPSFSCSGAIWVVSAHLPHYSGHRTPPPGAALAAALERGSSVTGCDASATPTIVMGDFNEFGECPLAPLGGCHAPEFRAASREMTPLWDYFGRGSMADAIEPRTVTCCTKWHENVHNDWTHHFDHVYYSSSFFNVSDSPSFIPYAYPGTRAPCSHPTCAQPAPPHRETPAAQGSWHRGWQLTLRPRSHPERRFVV